MDRKLRSQISLDIFCLFFPILVAIPFIYSKEGVWSFSFMFRNLYTSISYLFNYKQSTVLTTLAALVAVGQCIFYKKDNLVIGLAGWFLMGFLMISAFCAGGISYPSDAYS